ncbi:MAG TPA: hypothetical protein VK134_01585 [Ktedonobacteraceae bacterium]|nr:hypothetical protein [Ktedonobacteraceae bacterium]
MSWNPNQGQGQGQGQGQDPNQPGQYPNQPSQYGGPTPPPSNDPYGAQQGGYQQPPQQPPVYGQQQYGGYQQPYGSAASALGPTSMGMQANVAAGLSYVAGWITGLIFFFGEKQNRFVRFNAMQSILLYAALTVFYIVLDVLATALAFSGLGILLLLFGLLIWLVGLGALALWIVLMINAFQGKYLKLPIIGDYAERFAGPGM